MSLTRFRLVVITGWFAAVATLFGARLAMGGPLTVLDSAAALVLACVPPLVFMLQFHGAGSKTVAQVLYVTEQNTSTNPARTTLAAPSQVKP